MRLLWKQYLYIVHSTPTVASAAKDAVGNVDLATIQKVKDAAESLTSEESKKDN